VEHITPTLWFVDDAEDAVAFYMSVFPDSRVLHSVRYGAHTPPGLSVGSVLTITFEIAGRRFVALNGGVHDAFNDAVSFTMQCDSQDELDRYWDALSAVPAAEQCGWCRDRFGVRWQILPRQLDELLGGDDPAAAERVFAALMQMRRIDIAALEAAAAAPVGGGDS
jgi:predicted 3-demethylubiquinone-9 3-methyltransferase (glyoxalase superfamily)